MGWRGGQQLLPPLGVTAPMLPLLPLLLLLPLLPLLLLLPLPAPLQAGREGRQAAARKENTPATAVRCVGERVGRGWAGGWAASVRGAAVQEHSQCSHM